MWQMSRLPGESQAQTTKLFCTHDFYHWRLAFRCCFHPQVLANLLPRLPYCYDWGWVFRGSLVLYSAPMTCAIFLILGLTYWLDLGWQVFDEIRYRIAPGVLPHSPYHPISLPCFSLLLCSSFILRGHLIHPLWRPLARPFNLSPCLFCS